MNSDLTIVQQALHYAMFSILLTFGLVYYKREKFTHWRAFVASQLVANLLINFLYVRYEVFGLPVTALSQILYCYLVWKMTKCTLSESFLIYGLTLIFTFIFEGFSVLVTLTVVKAFVDVTNWNVFVGVISCCALTLALISLPVQKKIGQFILEHSKADLHAFLPLAALVYNMQFYNQVSQILTSHINLIPNLTFAASYTLLFLGFIIWQIRNLTIKMAKESGNTAIQLGKSIAGSYLSSRHDLKNLLAALQYDNPTDVRFENTTTSIFQAVIRLKQEKAATLGIDFSVQEKSLSKAQNVSANPEADTNTQTELDASILLGILLDNALEHLEQHPTLPRNIVLTYDPNTFQLKVTNPVDTKSHAHLEKAFQKGHSSKQSVLTSGFGLYNANVIANRMNRRLSYALEGALVVFEVM